MQVIKMPWFIVGVLVFGKSEHSRAEWCLEQWKARIKVYQDEANQTWHKREIIKTPSCHIIIDIRAFLLYSNTCSRIKATLPRKILWNHAIIPHNEIYPCKFYFPKRFATKSHLPNLKAKAPSPQLKKIPWIHLSNQIFSMNDTHVTMNKRIKTFMLCNLPASSCSHQLILGSLCTPYPTWALLKLVFLLDHLKMALGS